MDVREQRHFQRVPFATESTVELKGKPYNAEVVDICLKGALLRLSEPLQCIRGEPCSVSINLSNSDIVIRFEAEVAHTREELLGVKLLKIDLDSMTHLRHIVELNTADPDQVRRELYFLYNVD